MGNLTLSVQTRKELKKSVKKIREQGQIPAVLYGHNVKPRNLAVAYTPFQKIYQQAGESTLIDVTVDKEKPVKVLIQEVQYDPVKSRIIHVDFHQVRMDEKITAAIPIKFVDEAPAVKELGGTLVTNLHEIKVKCLPNDLIHEIEVDISSLKTFDDLIHVKELKIPGTIEILENSDEVVASVTPPRSEEELKELEQAPKAVVEAEAAAKAEAEKAAAPGAEAESSAKTESAPAPAEEKK